VSNLGLPDELPDSVALQVIALAQASDISNGDRDALVALWPRTGEEATTLLAATLTLLGTYVSQLAHERGDCCGYCVLGDVRASIVRDIAANGGNGL